jgi:hypothetical protein
MPNDSFPSGIRQKLQSEWEKLPAHMRPISPKAVSQPKDLEGDTRTSQDGWRDYLAAFEDNEF